MKKELLTFKDNVNLPKKILDAFEIVPESDSEADPFLLVQSKKLFELLKDDEEFRKIDNERVLLKWIRKSRKKLWELGLSGKYRNIREGLLSALQLEYALNHPEQNLQIPVNEWLKESVSALLDAARLSEYESFMMNQNMKKPESEGYPGVILLAGLPASGKDTFIANNFSDLPVVSLDGIREEFGISPVGDQSEVVRIARKRAIELLKQKKGFIWNATSITPRLRKQTLDLFRKYGAAPEIIYLETDFDDLIERNANRKAYVPEQAIERMMKEIEPPYEYEADKVSWIYS